MDPKLVQSFDQFWQGLTTDNDCDNPLPEGEFLGCKFWVLKENHATLKRLNKLHEILEVKHPLVLACKSDLFWKEAGNEAPVISQFITRRKKKSSSSSVNEYNSSVCGSPLKLDVIADLSSIDDSCYQPTADFASSLDFGVTVNVGRQILSLYSMMFARKEGDKGADGCQAPMLAVLCNSKHMRSISCISVSALVDKQNNFIGLKTTEVISKQPADQSMHRKTQLSFGASDISCQAKYDVLDETDGLSPHRSIGMILEWKKRSDLISLIPLYDPPVESKATVNIQVSSGSCESQAFGLFQEIEILGSLVHGLTTSEVVWIGCQERPLVESAEDLIEQLKSGCTSAEYRLGETITDDHITDDMMTLKERKDFDFTDHLWKVLQNCTSNSELVETFTYIISVLKSGELQPYIQSHNHTTIATMVRDSYKGQLRVPSLIGLLPIEYLAEMGLEKLTRDYVFLIVSQNLAPIAHLDYFIKGNIELREKLVRLEKLHNILEVVLVLKKCMNLTQSTLTECTRQMLKHYESNGKECNRFSFNIPARDVSHLVKKHAPIEWKAEGFTTVGKFLEKKAYLFSTEQPFDWVKFEMPINKTLNSSNDVDETPYFLTIVKENVRIIA